FDFDDLIMFDVDPGAAGELHHARYCLPAYMQGQSHTMTITPRTQADLPCGAASVAAWIDEVQVVEDAACDDPTTEGFEHAPVVALEGHAVVDDALQAHSGSHYLELSAPSCANLARNATIVMNQPEVPPDGPGPALTFWSRSVTDPSATGSFPAASAPLSS